MESCIYEGWIRHRRYTPVENSFRVRASLIYLALEELEEIFAGRWCWSTRRAAIARFRRADHLGDAKEDLRTSVTKIIGAHGGNFSGGPIRLLTHLRYWGFGFNPVSFYFCFQKDNPSQLEYVVAEVTNTPWGQKHAYVLRPAQFDPLGSERVAKEFHVSPFMNFDLAYRFAVPTPDKTVLVHMANIRGDERLFDVTMRLNRRPINTKNLARVLLRYPAMTLQVVGHIYFQAARLWWKGVPYISHPAPGKPHGNLTETSRQHVFCSSPIAVSTNVDRNFSEIPLVNSANSVRYSSNTIKASANKCSASASVAPAEIIAADREIVVSK